LFFTSVEFAEIYKIFKDLPPFTKNTIWISVIILLLFLIGLMVWRVKKGDEVILFKGLIQLKPSTEITKLKDLCSEMKSINHELLKISKQKAQLLFIKNEIIKELVTINCIKDFNDIDTRVSYLYDFLFSAISRIITKDRDNMHKVAFFVPDNENKRLIIAWGNGYSREKMLKISLDIDDSAAGRVYKTGTDYNCGNVRKDNIFKNYSGDKLDYCSLICVPVRFKNYIVGVLSVDGVNEGSFDSDDMDYIRYFADINALIYSANFIIEERKELYIIKNTLDTEEGGGLHDAERSKLRS